MNIADRWVEKEGRLETTVDTVDFLGAITLIQQIADIAEEQRHHPNLHLHNYSKLTISLISHDAGQVTERDRKLAAAIDNIL
ncbi:MAG: 4a-hydroxytetrahydrobiopterin dehydratase [Candidatus Saccharimonadales bacterium]